MTTTEKPDWSFIATLCDDAAFRSELLFFLRLCNNHLQAIFWDVFANRNKNAKGRREKLWHMVTEGKKIYEEDETKRKNFIISSEEVKAQFAKKLNKPYDTTIAADNLDNIDFLSAASVHLFKFMNAETAKDCYTLTLKDLFMRDLRERHFMAMPMRDFIEKILEPLHKVRDGLEHYEDRTIKQKNIAGLGKGRSAITAALQAVGLLLPPEFCHLLVGRIKHYRYNLVGQSDKAKSVWRIEQEMESFYRQAAKERRQLNLKVFGLERTRQNIQDKSRRKSLVSSSNEWAKAYTAFCQQHSDDYRLHEFKWRYFMIGSNNIKAIRSLLGHNIEAEVLNFKHEIQPFYMLTCKINFHIHALCAQLPFEYVPKKDNKIEQKKLIGKDEAETRALQTIRNAMAHHHLFWNIHDRDTADKMSVEQLLSLLARVLAREGKFKDWNDFYNRMLVLLKREKYSLIDRRHTASAKIEKEPRWTQALRAEKEQNKNNPDYKVNKREKGKRVVAQWVRALHKAHAHAKALTKSLNQPQGAVCL